MMIVVRKVALDLVVHNLLNCPLDTIYDHFKACFYQRVCFPNLLHFHHVAKLCRCMEQSNV